MKFGARIGIALLAAGVLPVAFLGLVSYLVSRGEVERTVGRMQVQAAEDLALFTERTIASSLESVRLSASALPLEGLSRGELSAILTIPYRQLPFVSIVAIVDDSGAPIAGPAFERRPDLDPAMADREPVSDAALGLFSRRIPSAPAEAGASATSAPYRAERGPLRVAVAHRLGPGRALVAEIVLRDVEARIAELSSEGGVAHLLDGRGDVLVPGEPDGALAGEERALHGADALAPATWQVVRRADGRRWLAASAPVRGWGWRAVVAQPAALAFGAAERLRVHTIAWAAVGLLLAAVLGTLLARRVTGPVERLSRAAGAIAAGDYGTAIETRGKDEIADLGRAFAGMTGELRRRDEEIRAWNAELQRRVEERTAELAVAQDQILRTRRLAALGSLGAGLAHELNNPMTAITGYLAILGKSAPPASSEGEMVARAQEQAARVSRIVDDLRKFADQERGALGQRFSLDRAVDAALSLYEGRLRASGIALSKRVEEVLPEAHGDPAQIQQVVAHLVENAINAMPSGGRLEVSLGTVAGDAIRLRVADTGGGIPAQIRERIFDPFFTTKGRAGQVGLGLSVSHSIVEAHHGRILVESEDGVGAAVTVLLPVAAEAHLA